MVLVDTSVWIDHLRNSDAALVALLQNNAVYMHPMVLGEIACGNVHNRAEILTLLEQLPHTIHAEHREVLQMIERHALIGQGIGYIDVHLLAACMLTGGCRLWTRDIRLQKLAQSLDLAYNMR